LKSNASHFFGDDIILHDNPTQDQRNIAICSAYNGWLFAVYSNMKSDGVYITILKSINDGETWSILLYDVLSIPNTIIKKIDLETSGNDNSNLKLFLGIIFYDTIVNQGNPWVGRYNVEPFSGEAEILDDFFSSSNDLVITTDIPFSASNSSPNSIGILYSKNGPKDSIIFRSSSDGGIHLNNRKVVATTDRHFNKVALSYGYSNSFNTGRYFGAWEKWDNPLSGLGNIYTAYSEQSINSAFTSPICIDSLSTVFINQCNDPLICCQASDYDNNYFNITEIVGFSYFNPETSSYDILGFYNLQSTVSSNFQPIAIANSTDNELQADISFNHFDSSFMVTFYDSTLKQLPFITNMVNLTNPNNWEMQSSGYNDEAVFAMPLPKVCLNMNKGAGANVWISNLLTGNGIAFFDAPYIPYTAIREKGENDYIKQINIYPNPCNEHLFVDFTLFSDSQVIFSLVNSHGAMICDLSDKFYFSGKNFTILKIPRISSGYYFLQTRVCSIYYFEKIVIQY
jgi:hypothetical protein